MPSIDPPASLFVDALIVGGGPVGLLTGLQLTKMGCKALIIDQEDKPNAPIYGRACTLWPRTLELLDQLGLGDALLDKGVVSRDGRNFRDGQPAPGGLVFGMDMHKHESTTFRFALHLRQRLIERTIEEGLAQVGGKIRHQHKLESWADAEDGLEYPVVCFVRDMVADELVQVRCKYLVACDGGRSGIRKQAGVEFIGERSGAEWIRMDAVVKTDMPDARLLNSVQSATHGLVLFCPIDNGRTRIGYVFNEELQRKYGGSPITKEVAMEEAKKALAPFTLDFDSVDWVTLYGIGQCIASRFVSGRVLLAGDACHTHSSGSAQGLNTGAFDATNLAWKLALVLKGHAPPALLDSYDSERRALVQQVIDNDKTIATLISGKRPARFAGREESPRDLLTEWFNDEENVAFTIGTGIKYHNVINLSSPLATLLPSGHRLPDCLLARTGTLEPTRLHSLLPNTGAFHLVVFTGIPSSTTSSLIALSAYLSSPASFMRQFAPGLFRFITVIGGEGIGAAECLGVEPWGRAVFDPVMEGHKVCGVDAGKGAIVVCRPDGYVGTVVGLDEPALLGDYFARFLNRKAAKTV